MPHKTDKIANWKNFLLSLVFGLILVSCTSAQAAGQQPADTRPGQAAQVAMPTAAPTPTRAPMTPAAEYTLSGREFYAAPDGSRDGDGSIENPWDLKSALRNDDEIGPGDILWLRGGFYSLQEDDWHFVSRIWGEEGRPVIVRAYPGERATVENSIEAYGEYSWFWGLEITNPDAPRDANQNERPPGLTMVGKGQKAINMIVHNVGHPGIGFWEEPGDGGEIYGTLIWGVGLYDETEDEWTRGSGIYTQNREGTRYIREVISFRNFSYGIKIYSEEDQVDGFFLQGNVVFDNQQRNIHASGRDHPFTRLVMDSNFSYRAANDDRNSIHLGYSVYDQGDAVLTNNYFVAGTNKRGALWSIRVQDLTMKNNILVSRGPLVNYDRPLRFKNLEIAGNTYYSPLASRFRWNGVGYDFSHWKRYSEQDSASQYIQARPNGLDIFVRPNAYEEGRGHVIVYNWNGVAEAQVDLSTILEVGQSYRVVDAQNYFGEPAAEGTYEGGLVTLPLDLSAVAEIVGEVTHFDNVHTGREFNVFVVIGD